MMVLFREQQMVSNVKSIRPLSGLSLALCLVVCGCISLAAAPAQSGIPATLDIPADFKVQESDWLDNTRARVGWPLGMPTLRGKTLRQRDGVYPIHVMKAELPDVKGTPLLKDDLIIAVNGMALGKAAVDQFISGVTRGIEMDKPVSVTRWRKGTVATVEIDFGFLKKDDAIPILLHFEKV